MVIIKKTGNYIITIVTDIVRGWKAIKIISLQVVLEVARNQYFYFSSKLTSTH